MTSTTNNVQQKDVFISAEEAIAAFAAGEMLILTDDEDRENEGDFVMAAEFVDPAAVNFMALHGRGLVCISITRERARQLQLPAMVDQNTGLLGTPFTVSVDAVKNTTTGISAADRYETIATMINDDSEPHDLARPGHLFPLVANPAGVLVRPGHTEAVVDLAKAGGLYPAGVLCEILNEDGTMARLPQLIKIAERFDLKIASVADIVDYRRRTEQIARRVTDVALPNTKGDFQLHLYENRYDENEHHIAMVKGDVAKGELVTVRVHSECLTGDVFGSHRCDCGLQLDMAMDQIAAEGCGVIVYMRQEGRGIGLANKIKAYRLQEEGKDTVEANEALGFAADSREYWFAAQMLKDLGVQNIRLLTNNPLKVSGLQQYGINVVERVALQVSSNPENEKYLRTKKEKMGHILPAKAG